MPQAKKKQSTKTTKKTATRKSGTKAIKRTTKSAKSNNLEKWHVYIMTALSMITAILLCADAVIMAVI